MQTNLGKLNQYGYHIIEPRESLLACGDYGKGALAQPDVIVDEILKALA